MQRLLLPLIMLAGWQPLSAAVFNVTSASDLQPPSPGTLRAAILSANTTPGADTIKFVIGSGVQTIALTSSLPAITEALTIRGDTQPGFHGRPLIVLDGVNAGSGAVAITLNDHDGSTIRALNIQRCNGAGIGISNGSGHQILGNYLGTDQAGLVAHGNEEGIYAISCDDLKIGGAKKGEGNLVSGNNGPGIYTNGGDRCLIYGNRVGVDATGQAALGNNGNGIGVGDGTGHRIGGPKPGQGNLSSGNATNGIIVNGATDTVIAGNRIGTDATGTKSIPNGNGIDLIEYSGRVGGTKPGERNLISGNDNNGLEITDQSAIQILGNYIGVDRSGKKALGNDGDGIAVHDLTGTLSIGAKKGGNVIAANKDNGITFQNTGGAQVLANRIGVNAKGKALANGGSGVELFFGAHDLTIGAPGAGNVIANNGDYGVHMDGTDEIYNTISANRIFLNGLRGISLNNNTPRTNDALDVDNGANHYQNYPVITKVKANGTVSGTLSSAVSKTYRVEFFVGQAKAGTSEYQGRKYLGTLIVQTDANGDAPFTAHLATSSPLVIATATDVDTGETSEFSPPLVTMW